MPEKKFLNFVLTEGCLLFVAGLLMLILPKFTSITIGVLFCISIFIYGIYKIISAINTRNFSKHYPLNLVLGILLAILGLVLFFKPMINFLIISSFLGLYFILESISTTAFAIQTRKLLYLWWVNLFVALFQLLTGILFILTIPTGSFWIIGIFVGLNFLFAGIVLINMFISNKYYI